MKSSDGAIQVQMKSLVDQRDARTVHNGSGMVAWFRDGDVALSSASSIGLHVLFSSYQVFAYACGKYLQYLSSSQT